MKCKNESKTSDSHVRESTDHHKDEECCHVIDEFIDCDDFDTTNDKQSISGGTQTRHEVTDANQRQEENTSSGDRTTIPQNTGQIRNEGESTRTIVPSPNVTTSDGQNNPYLQEVKEELTENDEDETVVKELEEVTEVEEQSETEAEKVLEETEEEEEEDELKEVEEKQQHKAGKSKDESNPSADDTKSYTPYIEEYKYVHKTKKAANLFVKSMLRSFSGDINVADILNGLENDMNNLFYQFVNN
ncbi:Merozoite surface protein (SPAM), putative [Plasmodium malariae]|uniref:Merozoite surface protein (SPAM), putative n=1 Tax=Plasmodium malariae TaxID=5858 RepID=A0A1C3KE61_PLAMA|nr:Merozoite surface protein (SPAM), putative [Plasmodium malariae]